MEASNQITKSQCKRIPEIKNQIFLGCVHIFFAKKVFDWLI